MSDVANFCPFCGNKAKPDTIHCSSCGQMISGERALSGPAEFKLPIELIIIGTVTLFLAINIINLVLLWLIPKEYEDVRTWGFMVPISITIVILIFVIIEELTGDGIRKWIGTKLNPYKPMKWSERIGEFFGSFFLLFFGALLLQAFMDPENPLFTEKEYLVIISVFLPLILDISVAIVRLIIGNPPEARPLLMGVNFIKISAIYFLLMNWPFNIPEFILWIEELLEEPIISSNLPEDMTLSVGTSVLQITLLIVSVILLFQTILHLIIFISWLDVRYSFLGGTIAGLVSVDE